MNGKSRIIQKAKAGDNATTVQVAGDYNVGTEFIDSHIRSELKSIINARFFSEYDGTAKVRTLGKRICNGDLAHGSGSVRCLALAWCSRILYISDVELAKEFLDSAKEAGSCLELQMAEAFLLVQDDQKPQALKLLSKLDTPAARTAALMIVAQKDSARNAINWASEAGIGSGELDSEGRFFLLQLLLREQEWDSAFSHLDNLVQQDYVEAPILHHMTAITRLLGTVPVELRYIVLDQIPLNSSQVPLADNDDAIQARREARKEFIKAKEVALAYDCSETARREEQYALWLELLDRETKLEGLKRLDRGIRSSAYTLHLVPLALDYGIDLNLDDIDRKISQQVALRGGPSMETSMARIYVGLRQTTPKKAHEFLDEHFNELKEYLNPLWLQSLQVEMLARSGMPKEAETKLRSLASDGIQETEVQRLRKIISESGDADPIDSIREKYNQTGSLPALQELVEELCNRGDWGELPKFAETLYVKTRNLYHAEIFVKSLSQNQTYKGIIDFLSDKEDFVGQSQALQINRAWALFYEGEFVLAKEALSSMECGLGDPNYRGLSINLSIFTGEWESLLSIVDHERNNSGDRSARELLQIAQLAVHVNAPESHVRDLVHSAVQKADGDPSIYASAYFLTSRAGWDENNETSDWMRRAVELSDENGPIKQATLKDVLDMRPGWETRVSAVSDHLKSGEMPMFLAGDMLNRSLLGMMLLPALLNMDQVDPRRRVLIPAFSGNRNLPPLSLGGKLICLDATAIITLGYLDFLGQFLDSVDQILIPHATLSWLFEEKQKVEFHQPARVRDAHKLRDLVSRGKLEKFNPSTKPESDLADQVGDELASFIAEAQSGHESDDRQHLVVKPGPVHQIGSLREEEVDLSDYSQVLCSCLSLVEKLNDKAQLTKTEFEKAKTYLSMQEMPWPNQPAINDGAVIYLDDLAINYLMHLGFLDKLHKAGLQAIVSPDEYNESNALIGHEGVSNQIISIIEKLRSLLSSGIRSGKIITGKSRSPNSELLNSVPDHPSVDVIALAQKCDIVISDDRFYNKHQSMRDGQKPICTTLDVLSALTLADRLDPNVALDSKIKLLRSGYAFIALSEDELAQQLESCSIREGRVVESIELKAIRESLLCLRMGGYLKVPEESHWLINNFCVFVNVLKRQWLGNPDESISIARSDWLFAQLDARGWAGHFKDHNGPYYLREGGLGYILMLMHAPHDASPEAKLAYQNWITDRILVPYKEQFPDSYDWIVKHEKELFINLPMDDNLEGMSVESES
ncbi:PIN domain-containing protein [Cerasicoccus fimbriatus]|uniref:HTH domain-containing protein n=1 Tax=Cerasicoccus fimbriatus TaxID=3014554 RepID=UPI0022B38DAA|nr:hypothetical protein [Cerasicoccus sp. TK19100]